MSIALVFQQLEQFPIYEEAGLPGFKVKDLHCLKAAAAAHQTFPRNLALHQGCCSGTLKASQPCTASSILQLHTKRFPHNLQVDPLASLDIDKLNAAYMQRNQNSLLGTLNNPPATAGIGNQGP